MRSHVWIYCLSSLIAENCRRLRSLLGPNWPTRDQQCWTGPSGKYRAAVFPLLKVLRHAFRTRSCANGTTVLRPVEREVGVQSRLQRWVACSGVTLLQNSRQLTAAAGITMPLFSTARQAGLIILLVAAQGTSYARLPPFHGSLSSVVTPTPASTPFNGTRQAQLACNDCAIHSNSQASIAIPCCLLVQVSCQVLLQ